MRPSDQQIVRALPLFAGMEEAHFRSLMNAALLQAFPPHVVLVRQGELPDFLYVLVEGSVELFATYSTRESVLQVIAPTSTFIIAPVICEEVALKSARTSVESRVLMIPADAVRDVFGHDAAFARAVVKELALRYRDLVRALKGQKLRMGPERLANWILQEDAHHGFTGQVTVPFEKRLLASLLGMTPENLSRSFAALGKHGVETDASGIFIKDRQKLRRLAHVDPLIEDYPVEDY
jgi:CRP/FNR family transcriptional regulator, transcriptional activator FtrB